MSKELGKYYCGACGKNIAPTKGYEIICPDCIDKGNKTKIGKTRALMDICEQIDILYYYANGFISKETVHNLGFKKEMRKDFIEKKIMSL